jgi:hypothetical protein
MSETSTEKPTQVPEPQNPHSTATEVQVCLAVGSHGEFLLEWSAKDIGEDDWVGLYANPNDGDDAYIGREWQWARDGSNYQTDVNVQGNFQARYLVPSGRGYVSVARTPAFPYRVCS